MKKQSWIIVRVVITDKRKETDALEPKGMESDYGGYYNIMGNGYMIPGLKMASKVFTTIYGAELGKPDALPQIYAVGTL